MNQYVKWDRELIVFRCPNICRFTGVFVREQRFHQWKLSPNRGVLPGTSPRLHLDAFLNSAVPQRKYIISTFRLDGH